MSHILRRAQSEDLTIGLAPVFYRAPPSLHIRRTEEQARVSLLPRTARITTIGVFDHQARRLVILLPNPRIVQIGHFVEGQFVATLGSVGSPFRLTVVTRCAGARQHPRHRPDRTSRNARSGDPEFPSARSSWRPLSRPSSLLFASRSSGGTDCPAGCSRHCRRGGCSGPHRRKSSAAAPFNASGLPSGR